MSKYKNLFKYFLLSYFKTNKSIIPLIIWFTYLISCFQPFQIWTETIVASGYVFFVISVLLAFTFINNIDNVEEQILMLKTKTFNTYYNARLSFIYVLNIILGLVTAILLLIVNLLKGGIIFEDSLSTMNVFGAVVFYIALAILGGTVGIIFDKNYIKKSKLSLVLTLMITILTLAKISMISQFPMIKNYLFVIPPLYDISNELSTVQNFTLNEILITTLYSFIYSFVLLAINRVILVKHRINS